MFITILFLSALSIAAVAAYFSITGLVAVFSASALAIIVMGSVIEAGKLVAVSYVYRFWELIGFVQKSLMIILIAGLMALTSIGIFGFLSKAHLEKVGPQEQYVIQIDRLEEKIGMERKKIDRNQSVLDNLDQALDKYIELGFVTRGLKQREEQSEQRAQVEGAISTSENKIDEYRNSISDIRSNIQDIELKVGPIKYIAEIIYGDGPEAIDKAVKILIIILVCMFDPLAIMLLICANHAHMHRNDKRVRSEFSMFDKDKSPVQDEKLLYDDLSDDEKEEHRQKLREYVSSMNSDDENSVNEDAQKKYEGMVDKNKVTDEDSFESDETEASNEASAESPYKLHNLDKPNTKRDKSSWLPKFKK